MFYDSGYNMQVWGFWGEADCTSELPGLNQLKLHQAHPEGASKDPDTNTSIRTLLTNWAAG